MSTFYIDSIDNNTYLVKDVYMNTANRIEYIDIFKGIAIILVVLGHAIDNIVNGYLVTAGLESFERVHLVIYGFHMPAFFFCAGLFARSWARKPVKEAIWDKVLRLIVPYFAWVAVVTIIKLLTANYQNNPIDLKDTFLSPVRPFEQYWFLYTLFFIYVVFLVAYKLSIERFFWAIVVVGAIILPLIRNVWILEDFLKYSVFFLTGSVTKPKKIVPLKNKCMPLTVVFIVLNSALIFVKQLHNQDTALFQYYWYMTSAVGIAWLLSISLAMEAIFKNENWLEFCGKKSMEIYCIHPTILGGLRIVAEKTVGASFIWLRTICVTVITILTCICLFKIWKGNDIIYKTLFGGWGKHR